MRCLRWTSQSLESTRDSGRKTFLPRTTPESALVFDDLYFVAVGVFDKGDHRRAAFHRSWLARHLPAFAFDFFTGNFHVRHFDRDMAEAAAEVVAPDAVVIGQFEH